MVINQFHSIGDIIFLEPLYRHFKEVNGEKPIMPIRDHLMWITEYIQSAVFTPMSKFDWGKGIDADSMRTDKVGYFPARFANQILRGYSPDDHHDFENMMLDKYLLAKVNPELWKDIDLRFSSHKGTKLFDLLGLQQDEKYILINEDCQAGSIKIPVNTDMKVVRMKMIPGFSVVDWHLVMLRAHENHHVSTCTFFIMQAIANKYRFNSKVYLYPRPNEDGLRGISMLTPTFNFQLCYA
jgi:hypothetical protein